MTSTSIYHAEVKADDFADAHVALAKLELALEQAAGALSVISDHIELGTVNDNPDGLVAVAQMCQLAIRTTRAQDTKALNGLLDHIRSAGLTRHSLSVAGGAQ